MGGGAGWGRGVDMDVGELYMCGVECRKYLYFPLSFDVNLVLV